LTAIGHSYTLLVFLSLPVGRIGTRNDYDHLHQLKSDMLIAYDRPKLTESDIEKKLIRFDLVPQSHSTPVTMQDAIDFTNDNGLKIDKFSVCRPAERKSETLIFHQAKYSGTERRNVSADDLKRYFDAIVIHS
jgi:hypothetical protein